MIRHCIAFGWSLTHTHKLRHWIGKTYTNAQHLWINRIFIAAHCSAKRKRDESHTLPTQHTHHDSRSTTTKIAVYEMCLLMKLMIHFTDWTRIKTTHTCRCHRCHRCYRHTNLKSHNSIKIWERESHSNMVIINCGGPILSYVTRAADEGMRTPTAL